MCQPVPAFERCHKRVQRNGYFAAAKFAAERSKNEFAHIVVKR
jgi:hypothetical protein